MPTYGKDNFKESNVNYLNKDFSAIKESLMNYAKSYFPNTYRDFNETSPGMMLLEMNAYVGDVLSFYVDQQYREMLLPLAEERRNIITMAKMFGYKVKPIVPSFTDLLFTSQVSSLEDNRSKVDYSDGGIFNAGIEIASDTDSDIIFTTLEPIDFRISGSGDGRTIGSVLADTGLAKTYTLSRTVKAVSATQKTISFQIDAPTKFKKITIPDTNVVDIISCIDSNGNNWYEVDYLAQDKVPITTHYTEDIRQDAYFDDTGVRSTTAVPYSLTYITTTKRFTRETNLDNTTSLVFGNGVLINGQDGNVDQGFIDLEQIGVTIPGQTTNLNDSIDPLLGNEYSTLGETPNNTTLTITYRVGGGVESNLPVNTITSTPSQTADDGNTDATLSTVTNLTPARGGKDEEDILEIREKTKAFFSTQNRCVTKEDYEARILNIPGRFGNIAKVYVTKGDTGASTINNTLSSLNSIESNLNGIFNTLGSIQTILESDTQASDKISSINEILFGDGTESDDTNLNTYANDAYTPLITAQGDVFDLVNNGTAALTVSPIQIYVIGYNSLKQFVGNPNAFSLGSNDNLPRTLLSNIDTYLQNFKLLTDTIIINDGYIVNFGVFFDVIAEKYADKNQVKLACIQKIKDYFRVEKMQFNQPIYKSQLEFELMGVEGVRSIGHVTITQEKDYYFQDINGDVLESAEILPTPTYSYAFTNTGMGIDLDGDGNLDGGFSNEALIENNGIEAGYGYRYDFRSALSEDKTIILPPNLATPAVFELKNPNQNIQGRVR